MEILKCFLFHIPTFFIYDSWEKCDGFLLIKKKRKCSHTRYFINFRTKPPLIRTIWYQFDCNECCLSSRFHLSHVIIALQAFGYYNRRVVCDETAQMDVASWFVSRKFCSITKQLVWLTIPRGLFFPLSHVFVAIIRSIVLRRVSCKFILPVPHPRGFARLKYVLVAFSLFLSLHPCFNCSINSTSLCYERDWMYFYNDVLRFFSLSNNRTLNLFFFRLNRKKSSKLFSYFHKLSCGSRAQ